MAEVAMSPKTLLIIAAWSAGSCARYTPWTSESKARFASPWRMGRCFPAHDWIGRAGANVTPGGPLGAPGNRFFCPGPALRRGGLAADVEQVRGRARPPGGAHGGQAPAQFPLPQN